MTKPKHPPHRVGFALEGCVTFDGDPVPLTRLVAQDKEDLREAARWIYLQVVARVSPDTLAHSLAQIPAMTAPSSSLYPYQPSCASVLLWLGRVRLERTSSVAPPCKRGRGCSPRSIRLTVERRRCQVHYGPHTCCTHSSCYRAHLPNPNFRRTKT